jgi:nucleoid DNA-binding protein
MLIKELTQVIGDALARGEPVAIHDLGRFVARRQCKRRGRNPSSDAPLAKADGFLGHADQRQH